MTLYILLFLFLIIIIYLFTQYVKFRNTNKELKEKKIEELKDYFRKEWEDSENNFKRCKLEREHEFNNQIKDLTYEFEKRKNELDKELDLLTARLEEKEKRYNEVNQDLDLYRQGKIEEIDARLLETQYKKEILLESEFKEKRNVKLKEFDKTVNFLQVQEDSIKKEIEEIKLTLEDYRTKRAAINEELLRQKKIEENQNFYRIQINPSDLTDIEILRSTATRLQHPEIINKIIWSGYYQKPLAELRKRLLPNGDISCVYKATRIKTGEIYIGQTTSFDKRLQEHTRSALGIGTLASSQLHRRMLEDGPEQFTWEILEETPKDKLRERESYYIDFYDSKNYGLNSISGDKNK